MTTPGKTSEPSDLNELVRYPATRGALDWQDTCPWLIIFRALSAACSPTIIIFALIATIVSPMGFWVSEQVFIDQSIRTSVDYNFAEYQYNRSPYRGVFPDQATTWSGIEVLGHQLRGLDLVYLQHISGPTQLIRLDSGWRRFAYYLTGWLWSVGVWSLFATCICRVAVLRLARKELIGIDDAFQFGRRKFFASFTGILIPLFGVLVLMIPLALAGLLMKLDIGVALVGCLWIFALLVGLLIVMLVFGLLLAWPLIIASVSTEGQDSFDAMSRTFAYSYRRLAHYLWYLIIALAFGGVVWFIATQFTNGVIHFAHWGTSFGAEFAGEPAAPTSQISELPEASGVLLLGRNLIRFWDAFAQTVGAAFFHGFFWCTTSAIYLLLRKDLDQIDLHEVFVADEPTPDELPELEIDEDGIPRVRPTSHSDSSEAARPTDVQSKDH